jgi:hypothetical protein
MNVDAMLRRIDEEITGHRQEIAGRQVAIARLEDSRKVLMGLAEGDMIKAEMAKAERVGAPAQINGHAQPMLIVRRVGSGDEGPPPKAKKPRNYERERELAKARLGGREAGTEPPAKTRKKREYTSATAYGGGEALRAKVAALVAKTGPIKSAEIGNRLGMPTGLDNRQPLANALYELKRRGVLQRDESKLYSLARPGMQ